MSTPFKLRNGMLLLSTEAPGGIYNSTQLKKIAQLCDGDSALVKATEDQRLALFVQPAKLAAVTKELKAVGLGLRNYQDGLHQPTACIGDLCPEHVQDAMGTAMDLSQELGALAVSAPLKIGVNGCARCCVPTHTLDVSLIGDTGGYRVSLGGKNSQLPEMASFMAEGVPAAKLPKLIAKVVSVYKELAQKDESLQEVMERCGSKRFVDALAPYSQDAASDDPFSEVGSGPSAKDAGGDDVPELSPDTEVDTFGMDQMDIDPHGFDGGALEGDVPIGGDAGGDIGDVALADDPLALGDDVLVEDNVSTDELALDDIPQEDAIALDELATDDLGLENAVTDEMALDGATDELALDGATDDLALGGATDDLALDGATDDLALDEAPGDLELVDDETLGTTAGELELDDTPAAPVAAAPPPAAKPVAAVPGPSSSSDEDEIDFDAAEEVEGEEADAFEEKLNASIAEEESIPLAEDVNSAERIAAMQLVEAHAELPSVDAVSENLGVDDSFDDLGIDAPLSFEAEPEEFAEESITAQVAPIAAPAASKVQPMRSASAKASAGVSFEGIEWDAAGRVVLRFSGGASMAVNTDALEGERDFNAFGRPVRMAPAADGVQIEVDGVGFFLPKKVAS